MKALNMRKGTVIIYNKAPYRITDFHHNTPGKGQAVVQAKMRNLLTGLSTETRFNSTEDVTEADVHTTTATFLYSDTEAHHFMLSESYEQFALDAEALGDSVYYLQEQMEVSVTIFEGSPIGISLPQTVILTIEDTEPELRGATATSSPKPAKTDTGLSLTVPPFVKIGDRIVVNTDAGSYVKRAD